MFWKIKRDMIERNYSYDSIMNKINKRKNDLIYINMQKDNADIIIHFYTDDIINIDNIMDNLKIKMKLFLKNDDGFGNVLINNGLNFFYDNGMYCFDNVDYYNVIGHYIKYYLSIYNL